MNRTELRQEFSKKRREMDPTLQHQAAIQLTQHINQNKVFSNSQNIAFYSAVRGEINPLGLLQLALEQNKNCYLPILDPKQNNQLVFIKYKSGDVLELNQFKILEPKFDAAKILSPNYLDLVLVPLLAIDAVGNRLGSGAGYYDRTFEFLLNQTRPAKPFLLGLAYEWQRIENLAAEKWDVKLDAVATEMGVFDL